MSLKPYITHKDVVKISLKYILLLLHVSTTQGHPQAKVNCYNPLHCSRVCQFYLLMYVVIFLNLSRSTMPALFRNTFALRRPCFHSCVSLTLVVCSLYSLYLYFQYRKTNFNEIYETTIILVADTSFW
jgi:hypothetical protein